MLLPAAKAGGQLVRKLALDADLLLWRLLLLGRRSTTKNIET